MKEGMLPKHNQHSSLHAADLNIKNWLQYWHKLKLQLSYKQF